MSGAHFLWKRSRHVVWLIQKLSGQPFFVVVYLYVSTNSCHLLRKFCSTIEQQHTGDVSNLRAIKTSPGNERMCRSIKQVEFKESPLICIVHMFIEVIYDTDRGKEKQITQMIKRGCVHKTTKTRGRVDVFVRRSIIITYIRTKNSFNNQPSWKWNLKTECCWCTVAPALFPY